MELSNRLLAIVNLLGKHHKICDVGCDHGYIPIYLIQSKKCEKVIAADVGIAPLERAKEHIREYQLEDYIETRLSDGLLAIKENEVSAMICAGMGGKLMQTILAQSEEKVRCLDEIILQPQSEIMQLRTFLISHNLEIVDEDMVFEEGKYYPIMKCVPTQKVVLTLDEVQLKYGPILLQKKHPVLVQYLTFEKQKIVEIIGRLEEQPREVHILERMEELTKELDVIEHLFTTSYLRME